VYVIRFLGNEGLLSFVSKKKEKEKERERKKERRKKIHNSVFASKPFQYCGYSKCIGKLYKICCREDSDPSGINERKFFKITIKNKA
jgi:hypothetical protein